MKRKGIIGIDRIDLEFILAETDNSNVDNWLKKHDKNREIQSHKDFEQYLAHISDDTLYKLFRYVFC